MRFLVPEGGFPNGRVEATDHWVLDEDDQRVLLVNGQAARLRGDLPIREPDGTEVAVLRGAPAGVRGAVAIARTGSPIGTVRRRLLSSRKIDATWTDGSAWVMTGRFSGRVKYEISDGYGPAADVSQAAAQRPHHYVVDVDTSRKDAGGSLWRVVAMTKCVEALVNGGAGSGA